MLQRFQRQLYLVSLTPFDSVEVENVERIHVVFALEETFDRAQKLWMIIVAQAFLYKKITHLVHPDLVAALQLFVNQQAEFLNQLELFIEAEDVVLECGHKNVRWSNKYTTSSRSNQFLSII